MFPRRPRQLALLSLILFALSPTNAVPVHQRRQDITATTVMTQQTTDTAAGQMTQTCVISLTPITDDQGNPAVQEVKTCTVTMGNVNNGSNNGGSSDSSTTTSSADGSQSTDTSNSGGSSTDTSGSSGSSTDTSGGASGTDTASSGAASGGVNSAVSDDGVTSVPLSAVVTGSAATSTATAGNTNDSGAPVAGSISLIPASAVSTGADGGATAPVAASAADSSASASSSAFAVPGQKLQVLPIGLGVFAGISVIALIVVGLVTYERTKYRKAFRARKLAESGQAMGYGGMAQR